MPRSISKLFSIPAFAVLSTIHTSLGHAGNLQVCSLQERVNCEALVAIVETAPMLTLDVMWEVGTSILMPISASPLGTYGRFAGISEAVDARLRDAKRSEAICMRMLYDCARASSVQPSLKLVETDRGQQRLLEQIEEASEGVPSETMSDIQDAVGEALRRVDATKERAAELEAQAEADARRNVSFQTAFALLQGFGMAIATGIAADGDMYSPSSQTNGQSAKDATVPMKLRAGSQSGAKTSTGSESQQGSGRLFVP